ncbi:MAG: hypothetical protein KAT77_01075 [Nanoarchaeota archaeon]|nr:hypothetical protein [Nanoarchaeota archaeon]
MNPEEARQRLHKLLGEQLEFNKDFDNYFSLLKETMQQDLLKWCNDCKENITQGSVPRNPRYKDRWVFFRKIGRGVRCTLVKIKNSTFINIYLFSHKEYDDLRLEYGYKKSSYYGS